MGPNCILLRLGPFFFSGLNKFPCFAAPLFFSNYPGFTPYSGFTLHFGSTPLWLYSTLVLLHYIRGQSWR